MLRYLVVVCPDLAIDGELGREARTFADVIAAVTEFCPTVESVAPGVCALISRGPTRYFGGEEALSSLIRNRVLMIPETGRVLVGIADGLFGARVAANLQRIIPTGYTAPFIAPMPVTIFEDDALASLLLRLGIKTLGDFARLPADSVLARFGKQAASYHQVARGNEGEAPGMRSRSTSGHDNSLFQQFDFWGGISAAEERATKAVRTVQKIAGPESVFVAQLRGGRTLRDQSTLVLWDKKEAMSISFSSAGSPWPGKVPPPPPALVYRRNPIIELVGATGSTVRLNSRLDLNSTPTTFSIDKSPWQQVASWSGPWAEDTAWWALHRQRCARIQIVGDTGVAHLLVTRADGWVLEATYD
ncbi:MAG TPA: hypothetical protein VMU77_02145 [Acidimicrobiales bacterium]|nr:hypothetical protein [Acidimicrobiales bacterium]